MIDGFREYFNGNKYCVDIRRGGKIRETIGAIKKRADGRWNWWRFPSTFHKKRWLVSEPVQGVEESSVRACDRLAEGWRDDLRPQSMIHVYVLPNVEEDDNAV